MQLNITRTDVTPSRSWTTLPLALKTCAELMTVLQEPGSKAAGIKFLTDLYMLYMTSPPKTSISVKSHDTVGARPQLPQPVPTLLLRCIWVAGLRNPDNEQAVVYFYQRAFTATLHSCTALREAAWPVSEPEAWDAVKELCMFCNILGKCSELVTEGSTPSCHPLIQHLPVHCHCYQPPTALTVLGTHVAQQPLAAAPMSPFPLASTQRMAQVYSRSEVSLESCGCSGMP